MKYYSLYMYHYVRVYCTEIFYWSIGMYERTSYVCGDRRDPCCFGKSTYVRMCMHSIVTQVGTWRMGNNE